MSQFLHWIQGIRLKIPSLNYWRSWNLCPKQELANFSWTLLLMMSLGVLILIFYVWLPNTTTLGNMTKNSIYTTSSASFRHWTMKKYSFNILEHSLGPFYYACTLVSNNIYSNRWAPSYNGFKSIIFVFMVFMIIHTRNASMNMTCQSMGVHDLP